MHRARNLSLRTIAWKKRKKKKTPGSFRSDVDFLFRDGTQMSAKADIFRFTSRILWCISLISCSSSPRVFDTLLLRAREVLFFFSFSFFFSFTTLSCSIGARKRNSSTQLSRARTPGAGRRDSSRDARNKRYKRRYANSRTIHHHRVRRHKEPLERALSLDHPCPRVRD